MSNTQLAYIEYEVILNLEKICGLSQAEIKDLVEKTDLLEFVDLSYELYHTQGIYDIIEDLSNHIKDKYNIEIPTPKTIN